jgi:hypothetical protein
VLKITSKLLILEIFQQVETSVSIICATSEQKTNISEIFDFIAQKKRFSQLREKAISKSIEN